MNRNTSPSRSWNHSILPVLWLVLLLGLSTNVATAQPAPERGPRRVDPRWHSLVHATVITEPGRTMEDATLIVRDGLIVSVTTAGAPALGSRIWDCSGLTIYPGLIEPHLGVELPRPPGKQAHWNEFVLPQRSPLDGGGVALDTRKELRSLGFTTAAVVGSAGIFRGTAAVFALGEGAGDVVAGGAEVLARRVYQGTAFDRSGGWGGSYPNSKMGSIALFRQTLADAVWYHRCLDAYRQAPERSEPPAPSPALRAIGAAGNSPPFLFVARDEWEVLRAATIGREFARPMMILGCGREFRRLDAIAALRLPIITPVDFPDAPNVNSVEAAEVVSLRSMMTWEQSPTQPRRLIDAGVRTALTTTGLKDRKQFHARVRKAIAHGLTERDALNALTREPARLLGMEDRLGTIAAGKLANLIVVDGNLFDEESTIRDVWVSGRRYLINAAEASSHEGRWEISVARIGEQPTIDGILAVAGKSVVLEAGDQELTAREVNLLPWGLSFLLDGTALGLDGVLHFTAVLEGEALYGTYLAGGEPLGWFARRLEVPASPKAEETAAKPASKQHGAERKKRGNNPDDDTASPVASDESDLAATVPATYPTPMGAFGVHEVPRQQRVLIKNATVWTSGDARTIEDAAVVFSDGRIEYVGPAADAPAGAVDRVIDARGKHVTPGIIDCHSHTGMNGGVNEGGERVTAEVRAQDVINPDDINWYRQLAGGLTAANQLHGSANAIGGQNSVVKLRWGVGTPDEMRLEQAPGGIKFALGENPKRVAANQDRSDEYPQTRLGVAALIEDRLIAGRDYLAEWQRFRSLSATEKRRTSPPRRDLELEALAEIIEGKRLVHCHSYRQDEILMLCRVAERLGFKIGTFQHVLEGYKVADAVRDAALGGSTFADWWAYKFEVIDAIPYNAAIMHEVGVCVSINSDSSEHARRLNTEAAKAVKYGGLDPHEALQLVTLNPAKQLGVADQIGSLEVGKDADVVVWSGDPLSYYSVCERTFVDGREYYSLERDRELRAEAASERQRLLQKLLAHAQQKKQGAGEESDAAGGKDRVIGPLGSHYYDDRDYCDDDHRGSCGCDELHQGEGN